MHPDESAADVDARMSLDLFHGDRVMELLPAGGGPAAARVGPGHHTDFLPAVSFGGFPLDDNGTVEVLTALGRQPDALRRQHRGNARVHGLRRFQAGILADVPAHDLTGRAAHHKDIALFQLCLLQQLRDRLPGFLFDLLFERFRHSKTPRF